MESRTFQLQCNEYGVKSLVNQWARVVFGDNKNLFGKWQAGCFVLQERIPPLMTTSMKPSIWTHPLDYMPTQTTFIRVSWTATGDDAIEVTATCEEDLAQGWFMELCDVLEAQPNADAQRTAQAEHAEAAPKPWEIIPDVGWNRKAVELWHAGCTSREIARMIGRDLTPKTILNVISSLRRIYGTDVVPERRTKSKPGRKLG